MPRPNRRPRSPVADRLAAFAHAFRGARHLLATQPNARIHLAAALAALLLGLLFRITPGEWLAVLLAIGLVGGAEALNTAVELLGDELSQDQNDRIGRAKDVAAFGVLAAALATFAVGLLVFGGRILAWLASE